MSPFAENRHFSAEIFPSLFGDFQAEKTSFLKCIGSALRQ
jgi:hypothetical protein